MNTKQYKNIKPTIIGFGVAGKRHLEAQLSLGIKTGVYSINPDKLKPLKNNSNIIVFDNPKKAMNWANLVHVCTPDNQHTEYVAEAIKKRKTILCEKSFTTSLSDALYLQKLAHQFDATVIIGQNYRLTPTFLETKKRVFEGTIGSITKIETTYLHDVKQYQQRMPSNKNGDFLYIGGSHAVDLACGIANKKVINTKAKMKKNMNLPNSYEIVLEFESGLLGNIKLDASSPRSVSGTDLIVTGTKGKLVSHNKVDELLFYKTNDEKPQSIKLANNKTLTTKVEVQIIDDYLTGKIKSFWPLPDVDEAVNTIKILDCVTKAIASGKNESVV